jgi:SPP1 family predicted phage head-tail adaptor
MTIPSGQLRNLITIQQRSEAQLAGGQPSTDWETFMQVWAKVVSMSGKEQFTAQQLSPEVTHQIKIRWLDGVTALMQILMDDGTVLDIMSVNYAERRLDDEVTLLCKQRVAWDSGN